MRRSVVVVSKLRVSTARIFSLALGRMLMIPSGQLAFRALTGLRVFILICGSCGVNMTTFPSAVPLGMVVFALDPELFRTRFFLLGSRNSPSSSVEASQLDISVSSRKLYSIR